MTIQVRCAGCRKMLNIPDKLAGKHARCPACGAEITIPRAGDEPDIGVMPVKAEFSSGEDGAEGEKAGPVRGWNPPATMGSKARKTGLVAWGNFAVFCVAPALLVVAAVAIHMLRRSGTDPRAKLNARRTDDREVVSLARQTPIYLRGARNEVIFFVLEPECRAINGKWAVPEGISMELGVPGGGFAWKQELLRKARKWGQVISANQRDRNERLSIRLGFTVPDVPGERTQTVCGTIKGRILYPQSDLISSSQGNWEFTTIKADLDLPVELTVLAEPPMGVWDWYVAVLSVYVVVLGIWAVFSVVERIRRREAKALPG